MTSPKVEYGLMIERVERYGTDYIEATVVRREEGKEHPLGCSSDGDEFFSTGVPKHILGLLLDGLGIYGFISEYNDHSYIGTGVEYRNVHAIDAHKAKRMIKTLRKINAQLDRDKAYEPGDKFVSLAKVLKASFVVERIGKAGVYGGPPPRWNWWSVADGRNRFRRLIDEASADANANKKEKVS